MNHHEPSGPPDALEAGIRGYLDAEAARVSAEIILARVRAAYIAAPQPTRRRWLAWAGASAATAASVAGLWLILHGDPQPVRELSATELLTEVKQVHEDTVDRCYEVQADWDLAPFQKRFPFRPPTRKATIWTRGDQFVVLSGEDGLHWAWGQERDGRVWIAPSRKRALVYHPDELNEPLARYCELMSLRLVSTLTELIERYDLSRAGGPRPDRLVAIEATWRRSQSDWPHPRFQKVELIIDPASKVVQKFVLHRQFNGEYLGTLTFSLQPGQPQRPEHYTLGGHLDGGALILDGQPLPQSPKIPPKLPPKYPADDPRSKLRDEILKRYQQQRGSAKN